ncbi:MAG: PHP domain-containing protein [Clostridia bacterium]|nr:PHP domain-containing protein [Clostridia bacterium]
MILTSDYHTHTVYSHGKGSILDNARSAQEVGLKEIGISDHGFSHPAFGLRANKVPKMKEECKLATEQTGVKVLMGIESNLIGTDGKVDLKPSRYDDFDVFLVGFHKFVLFKPKTIFSLFIPDLFHTYIGKPAKWVIKENTKAFVNAIKNNPIDVITHLNYYCFADVSEVAKVATDYGTYIELNAKKTHFTDQEIDALLKTDVRFVINSDAHAPKRVGEISLVEKLVERTNFPLDRIDNIDGRLPKMRFKAFKERG